MTIPSVLSMYGIVLGYICETKDTDFDIWSEKIILTPILFTAFWSLADPWTKMIVSMAPVPSLVGLTGVILLAVGIIATGYLATGGVGAYLASSSAGAVMGIGASFVVLLSDYVLRKYFRKRLLLALTFRNLGTSFGLVLIPTITNLLLYKTELKVSLLLMAMVLLPTVFGILTFRLPSLQRTSPYSLLLSTEEDNELPVMISSDMSKSTRDPLDQNYSESLEYSEAEERAHGGGLLSEGGNMYAYEEPDEDIDLFVNPSVARSNSKWEHELRAFKTFQFWAATVGWVGVKGSTLFFWVLLPTLSCDIVRDSYVCMPVSIIAGFATFVPSLASYKILQMTSQNRRLYFGLTCLLCGITLIGLAKATQYIWIVICAALGGIGIGSLIICQDLALYDVLGAETTRGTQKGVSTIVGLSILIFCFIHSVDFCLYITALLLFLGGFHWISSPALNFIKATRYRPANTMNRTSRDET
ncbi:uncharacterized protein LOC143373645 isoform X2 [Andrena cerasifolii]